MAIFPDFYYKESQANRHRTKDGVGLEKIDESLPPSQTASFWDKAIYFFGLTSLAFIFGFFIGIKNTELQVIYLFALSIILAIFNELGFNIPLLTKRDAFSTIVIKSEDGTGVSVVQEEKKPIEIVSKRIDGLFMGLSFILLSFGILTGYCNGISYSKYKEFSLLKPEPFKKLQLKTLDSLETHYFLNVLNDIDSIRTMGYGYTLGDSLILTPKNNPKKDSTLIRMK